MNTAAHHSMIGGEETPADVALKSSGGQYINLNWVPEFRDTIVIDFAVLNIISGEYAIVFGSNCMYNGTDWFQCGCKPNGYVFFYQKGQWSYTKDGQWFHATGYFNGQPYRNNKCFLFAQGDANRPFWNSRSYMIKRFSATHYGATTPYMDLVPHKNSGNPCMIDKISGTKYLNLGTGIFQIQKL